MKNCTGGLVFFKDLQCLVSRFPFDFHSSALCGTPLKFSSSLVYRTLFLLADIVHSVHDGY
uniref:Uncharacterized protein n=1 Tax=Anguilla anguilla TaxID=7936 RepID=A0A0E9PRD0_ANGAN